MDTHGIPMTWLVILLTTIAVLFTPTFSNSQLRHKTNICDSCLCIPEEEVVICQQKEIKQIPVTEPGIRKLVIHTAMFTDSYIRQSNLSGLNSLTFLKIIYSKLRGIESNAFRHMKQLNYLDLSYNLIQVIQPYTFNGLALNELHLMKNPGIKLMKDSFRGMTVKAINLRTNQLSNINYDTFVNIKLKKLFLYNNSISLLDPKFKNIFSQPGAIIDLSGNPLICNCDMKWIIPILKQKANTPDLKTVSFKCSAPLKLAGANMINLSVKDLRCPPKIKSISIVFGMPITQLTCIAVGNNYRAPGVAWNYVESENVRELRRIPLTGGSRNTEKLETSLTVNVTTQPNKQKAFTCTTWLDKTMDEKITVNIKTPPFVIPPPTTRHVSVPSDKFTGTTTESSSNINSSEDRNNDGTKDNYRPTPEYHFIFKKQFTVLEMIGAVVGTFVGTIILLMLIAQCIKWLRRNRKPNSSYKEINFLKPYWTLGHDSTNTYSHPFSIPDYDVPRAYESRAASICQSPPLNRMEFLDYKTQDRIYAT